MGIPYLRLEMLALIGFPRYARDRERDLSLSSGKGKMENIKLEKKGSIAYVTIDRPKVLNALNMATMEELGEAFTDLAADRDVRVVILTGSGEKAFVAGADINELQKNNPVEAKAYTHRGQAVLDLIESLSKQVIACINGFAPCGGCEIGSACTMRLAGQRR